MILIIDSDASKVIDAVRATGVTITRPMIEYTHYIIKSMKAIGTWDLCNAVYGFVGGTAASHKFNWKNPIDTDAAFRLTYPNGNTHNSLGMQGDGTNQFANTFINPSVSLSNTSTHLSFYSNTIATKLGTDIGTSSDGGQINLIDLISVASPLNIAFETGNNSTSDFIQFAGVSNSLGFNLGQINGTTYSLLNNQNIIIKTTGIGYIKGTAPIYLQARNSNSTPTSNLYSSRRYQYFGIGAGFTNTQAVAQSQIVTNAQNILNRA